MDWEIIILTTLVAEAIVCGYAEIRNRWVYKNRRRLIGTEDYKKLPPYEEMLQGHRFWSWDFESFYID